MARKPLAVALEDLDNAGDGLPLDDEDQVEDTGYDDEDEGVDEGAEMTPVVEDAELETEMLEAQPEQQEHEEMVAKIDETEEHIEALEKLEIEAASYESLGGMTPEVAESIAARVDMHSRAILGVGFTQQMPSAESFDLPGSRRTSTAVACEGIRDILQKALAVVISAIQRVIAWVKDLWKRMTDQNHAYQRRIEKIKKKVDAIKKGTYKLPDTVDDIKLSKSDAFNLMKGKTEQTPMAAINDLSMGASNFLSGWGIDKIGPEYQRFVEVQGRFLKIGFDRAQKHDFTKLIEGFERVNDSIKPYGAQTALEYKSSTSDEAKQHIEYKLCQELTGGKMITVLRAKDTSVKETSKKWLGLWGEEKVKGREWYQFGKDKSQRKEGLDITVFSGAKFGYSLEASENAPESGKETTIKPMGIGDIETALKHAEDIHKLNNKVLILVEGTEKVRKKTTSSFKAFFNELRSISTKSDTTEEEKAARQLFTAQLSAARKIAVALSAPGPEFVSHNIKCAKTVLDICDRSMKGATKVKDGDKKSNSDGDSKDGKKKSKSK